jgi:hypothetical protein
MKIKMKNVSFLKLYRYEYLVRLKHLSDQEERLFLKYVSLADWDRKNSKTFGMVRNISIRKLKDEYLPGWSIGKICEIRKKLIDKGYLQIKEKGDVWIDTFWIYQTSVRGAERAFQCIERGIHPSEQNVRQAELTEEDKIRNPKQELLERLNPFKKNVRPDEQSESG